MELVSIIVPIYNIEKYLNKCVDSLLNQTYEKIEIILVDDGSTDNSGKMCNTYSSNDNIKIVHKKNGGLSDARNYGLMYAKGNYVIFVDGDDFVDKNFVRRLYNNICQNNTDIACCNYYFYYSDDKKNVACKKVDKIITSDEALKDFFLDTHLCEVMAWNKIYKRSLFFDNNIKYPKGKYHEDLLTTYKLFVNAKKISVLSEPLYFYRQRTGSIMSSFNLKRLCMLDAIDEINEYCSKQLNTLAKEKKIFDVRLYLTCINNMIDSDLVRIDEFEQVRNRIIQDNFPIKYFKNYKKYFIGIFMIKNFCNLYVLLKRIAK